jgi:acetyl esterase/lipase
MDTHISPQVIPLWPAGVPGSESWNWQEEETLIPPSLKVVRNITQPTLTAYLPNPALANGKAVIVAPGGAFHFLSIEMEGHDVARWLCARGVAAFVLKYRLIHTGDDFPEVVWRNLGDRQKMAELMQALAPLVTADGQQAIRLVRGRASEWHIRPDRIGIMGFSAGGMLTVNTALHYDAASRPDFAAPIYSGGWEPCPIPPAAPPLFLLCANDDEMATSNSIRLYSEYKAAGHAVELHIYSRGAHGFGMTKQGLPSDTWIERFADWLAITFKE